MRNRSHPYGEQTGGVNLGAPKCYNCLTIIPYHQAGSGIDPKIDSPLYRPLQNIRIHSGSH